jgi:hypothetical protein
VGDCDLGDMSGGSTIKWPTRPLQIADNARIGGESILPTLDAFICKHCNLVVGVSSNDVHDIGTNLFHLVGCLLALQPIVAA